jgi:hypothetical protein
MPTKRTKDKAHWIFTGISFSLAIAALIISIFEFGESKLANRLMMEPNIDIVGVNRREAKEFHFMISGIGKVDINEIYYEYVILSMNKENEFEEHEHVSDNLNGLLKAGKKMPLKIELANSILPNKDPIISPIVEVIIDPIIFIGLKTKYRREIDSKPFENKFYYYTYPDTTKTYFRSGPIKLEDMTARLWWSAIRQIDEAFQVF